MARISRRCGWEELAMPVASMVNIILLLVVFFIAAEAIDRDFDDETINMPASSMSKAFSRKDPRSMTVNVRKDGTVNIGAVEMTLDEMKTEFRNAVDMWGPELPVIIRGDKDVSLSVIRDIMSAVSSVGLKNVVFNSITSTKQVSKNEKTQ